MLFGSQDVRWQAYVLNLADATDRWQSMEQRLMRAGIPYERVEAIRGRELPVPYADFDEMGHRLCTGRRPIPPEIGCYLSHIKAIDRFLETDQSHALFLEDDAVFDETLPQTIAAALQHADAWDMLRLQTVSRDRVVPLIAIGPSHSLGVNLTRSKGSAGYMLSRRAAARFRQRLLPMRMAYDIAFDIEFFWGLRAVAVTPYPIVADEAAVTQIQMNINSYKYGSSRYLTVFPFRAVVEGGRFFARLTLLVRLLVRSLRRPTYLQINS